MRLSHSAGKKNNKNKTHAMATLLQLSRNKSQARSTRSIMKTSSIKGQSNRSSSATLDSDWSGTTKTSGQTSSHKPPRSKVNRKRCARRQHGGIIENRWSQPDLTASPIKQPLRRYISTQDLLTTGNEVGPSRMSPKHLAKQRSQAAPYHYKKAAAKDEPSTPTRIPVFKTTASSAESINYPRQRFGNSCHSIANHRSELQENEATTEYRQMNHPTGHTSFSTTEMGHLHFRIEELEESNKKLTGQNYTLEKQLKQASELVRILLGKAKDAEKKAKKVSDLEMEIIVLRRQLAQSSSHDRIISVSSTLSDDVGWKSESDSVFDQSEARKSPIGTSDSNSQSSFDFDVQNKENISFPSSCFSRTSTLQRKRERAPPLGCRSVAKSRDLLDRADLNANYSTAYPCGDSDKFNTLLSEHKMALKLIQNLESKFSAQQKVIRGIKRDVTSVKHKSNSQSLEDVQDQLSLLIQSLKKENMSSHDIGDYLVETFHRNQSLITSDRQPRSRFPDVERESHSARRSLSLS